VDYAKSFRHQALFGTGKCKFHEETVGYLELIILAKGISMDEDIVEAVRN